MVSSNLSNNKIITILLSLHIFSVSSRLAYPMWILNDLFDGITDSSSLQMHMLYDVACLLQSHLLVLQIQFYNVTLILSICGNIVHCWLSLYFLFRLLKAQGREDLRQKMTLGIPILHSYGHRTQSQVFDSNKFYRYQVTLLFKE